MGETVPFQNFKAYGYIIINHFFSETHQGWEVSGFYPHLRTEYIKTQYQLDDACQWYEGKVTARPDATMMNKRLLFELKKYKDRLEYVDNYEIYTAKQLKQILTQQDQVAPEVRTFNDFMRQRIREMREEKRESYARMMEDTVKVFEAAEGEVPMILMNDITIDHARYVCAISRQG